MISFPFDNKSATEQDRNIDSDTFAEYLKRLTGGQNGVFAEVGTKLQVTAGTGMTVLVNPGDGFIEGRLFIENLTRELQVQASETLDRIDTVVVRLNKEQRVIDLYIVKGTSATVPQAPELTREGGIYELGIANVYVPKLTSNITQERITDTRLNTERCGIAPVLGEIDTQGLYDQYQSSLDQFLETVAQAIDGTLAGQLQASIDEVKNEIRPISTGGTGATTVAGARNALGLGNTSGALPIANGGTGKTTALEALLALGGIQIKKLWENARPASTFSDQKITLDLSKYDYIMVIFNYDAASNARMIPPIISPVNNGGGIIDNAEGNRRYFKTTATFINFDNTYPTNNKTVCIPLFIYGLKGVL